MKKKKAGSGGFKRCVLSVWEGGGGFGGLHVMPCTLCYRRPLTEGTMLL